MEYMIINMIKNTEESAFGILAAHNILYNNVEEDTSALEDFFRQYNITSFDTLTTIPQDDQFKLISYKDIQEDGSNSQKVVIEFIFNNFNFHLVKIINLCAYEYCFKLVIKKLESFISYVQIESKNLYLTNNRNRAII